MRFYVLWTRRVTVQILHLNCLQWNIFSWWKFCWGRKFTDLLYLLPHLQSSERYPRRNQVRELYFWKSLMLAKYQMQKMTRKNKQSLLFMHEKWKEKGYLNETFLFILMKIIVLLLFCGFISDSSSLFETSKTTFLIPANPLYLRSFVILIFSFLTKL